MQDNKKNNKLGMAHGTAVHYLRKMLLFRLVQETKRDICYMCGKKIVDINMFSIEHKVSWLDSYNPKEKFFDLDNIAYSHLICNMSKGSITPEILDNCPDNCLWCSYCRRYKHKNQFGRNRSANRKFDRYCKECRKIVRRI